LELCGLSFWVSREKVKVLTAKVAKLANKARTLRLTPGLKAGSKDPGLWIKITSDECGGIPKKTRVRPGQVFGDDR
jgi:hypothetical protein